MLKDVGAFIVASAGVMACCMAQSFAQTYPSRPIRIIASEIGGGNDVLARMIAQGIAGPLGQPVIVENRSSALGPEYTAKSTPDGYTVNIGGSALWLSELMRDKPAFRARDFAPITLVTTSPLLVTVHPSLPVSSVKELIALAKAKPGVLNYATGVSGASSHLAPELFKSMAGINMVRIPFKGSGPAYVSLISGESHLMISNTGSGMPYVKAGKIKALAVTTLEPSPLVPGLPTVAASGLPGYESAVFQAMVAPAKTPAIAIRRLNEEIVRVLHTPEVRTRLLNLGVEAVGSSPEGLRDKIRSEMTAMGKVIKDAGIKEE